MHIHNSRYPQLAVLDLIIVNTIMSAQIQLPDIIMLTDSWFNGVNSV